MEEGRLRVGKVTDTNLLQRLVRVHFEDVNIVSDWLKVISNPPFISKKNLPQNTEPRSGENGDDSFEKDQHDVIMSPWFPDVNDIVLCIFDSGFSPIGYVLGRIE